MHWPKNWFSAMNLKDLKYQYLQHRAQVIVFHKEGTILNSCHALVDIKTLVNSSAYTLFPLVQGMKEVFKTLKASSAPISLPAVDFSLQGRAGFYDMEFRTHPDDSTIILWFLLDNTPLYSYFQQIQQERNLLLIEKEDRENGRLFNR